MRDFLNVLVYPHQRLRHVQPEVNKLSDSVMRLYGLDLSVLRWAECREGVLVCFRGAVCPEMIARIPSAKLNCTALLTYSREDGAWGFQLCFKGTVEDALHLPVLRMGEGPSASGPVSPEQHAARLARRFPADREELLALLIRGEQAENGPMPPESFLNSLAPWAYGLLTSDQLAPAPAAPVPDSSSPEENAPDREKGQRPPEKEPGPETCLSFLTGVKALRRGWPFPLSLLYAFSPNKRPAPETISPEGWTIQELEGTLERFYSGSLVRLELDFTVQGKGTFIRRLKKTVYQSFCLTLVLIQEKRRCMCLLLDDQESTVYRLIADREPYMTVDIKDLKMTRFHGQTVEKYSVFQKNSPDVLRREIDFLLARLDRRDDALSATARMGVWSCEGVHFNKEQYQERRTIWLMPRE